MLKIRHYLLLSLIIFSYLITTVPAIAAEVAETDGFVPLSGLETVFSNFLGFVAGLAGIFAFLAIIVGGFKYITAEGDPKATASARATVTWAILGLVALILAWLFLQFIGVFSGIDVTIFKIPQ
ncbi:hypothetical protein HYW39_00840 [Candidatus Curtissbacteria bacterium]|nr:hypothetical protein [Candidatus Curtissbacteria bacterium]